MWNSVLKALSYWLTGLALRVARDHLIYIISIKTRTWFQSLVANVVGQLCHLETVAKLFVNQVSYYSYQLSVYLYEYEKLHAVFTV